MDEREHTERTDEPKLAAPPVPLAAPVLTPTPPKILCVDDEPSVLKVLQRALERQFEIVTASDPVQALSLLEGGMKFSVIISDMTMPQMDGAEFLARVRRVAPDSTRLALTGCLERELAPEEVFGILTKPCPLNLLQASVAAAVERHTLDAALRGAGAGPVPLPLRIDRDGALSPQSARRPELDLGPGLEFDPWLQHGAAGAMGVGASTRLSMLAQVAEKFFRLGQAAEAERILRPALWDFLQRCEVERRPVDGQVELAGRLALRLAEVTRSAAWVDYVFRLFTGVSRPLSSDSIEALHELMRRIPGVNQSGFARYLIALRACRHEFSPADHFLYRRIESLEALLAP